VIDHASMPAPQLDYGQLVERALEHARERALRRVVHDALCVVAEHGPPGSHHFFITFRTNYPGVVISEGLRARYPTEMTIVLQHEFWGLEVQPDNFAVTLSFNSVSERLEVPFDAVSVFLDPSVPFGLQFTVPDAPAETAPAAPPAAVAELRAPSPETASLPADAAPDEAGGAEVVTLDRFRKK
jgi:uncharacterized protein